METLGKTARSREEELERRYQQEGFSVVKSLTQGGVDRLFDQTAGCFRSVADGEQ